MKIFQISDLHLDSAFSFDEYKSMLDKMCETILLLSDKINEIYIVCCGDIVNKGEESSYNAYAKVVFDFLKMKLENKYVKFIFVPGNHDLCNGNLLGFNTFIKDYDESLDFLGNNALLYNTPELDFILINTSFHNSIDYGNVDIQQTELRLNESKKPVMIVMHHTFMNRYADDRSSLSNAYGLLEKIEKHRVIGVLHGHTHGFSNIMVGNQCHVIGVGSLFKYIPNCNNQFNVIDINLGQIERVINYRYQFDLNSFSRTVLYENFRKNIFSGEKASVIYSKVKDAVRYHGGINNLFITLETSLELFTKDMANYFPEDIVVAKSWLSESIPTTLYYNHGSYMIDKEVNGIDYVIEDLKRNSTSNRAIIPLIRFHDVLEHKHGYLPGLNCIQFGFSNDSKKTLFCSVYLRSLEVSRFLRINLSEVYILICRICEEFRSIKELCINLYAFKAQYKENFSCFKRADIDTITPGELAPVIYEGKTNKLLGLLRNKFDMQETVINTSGLHLLYDLMLNSKKVDLGLVEGLLDIINKMEALDHEYQRNSDYYTIVPMECQVHESQEKYLQLLETIDEDSTCNLS